MGGQVEGQLNEDSRVIGNNEYFDVWLLPETNGLAFTADLISEDFDAVLLLYRGFTERVDIDDDGGGGCNPRIVHAPANLRPYRLVVRSRGERQGGSYILRIAAGSEPKLSEPPCQM